jgi:hypothetical protein
MSTLVTVQPHPIGDNTNRELAITRKRVTGSSDNLHLQRVAARAELRTREGTTRRNIAKVIAPSAAFRFGWFAYHYPRHDLN